MSGNEARIGALLRGGGFSLKFPAPGAGKLTIGWYYLPRGARLSGRSTPRPTLVGQLSATIRQAGSTPVTVRLTAPGRHRLPHARSLGLTGRASFTLPGSAPITLTRSFTLHR